MKDFPLSLALACATVANNMAESQITEEQISEEFYTVEPTNWGGFNIAFSLSTLKKTGYINFHMTTENEINRDNFGMKSVAFDFNTENTIDRNVDSYIEWLKNLFNLGNVELDEERIDLLKITANSLKKYHNRVKFITQAK